MGAVLQHKEDGKVKPIHYTSKTLLPAEINYSHDRKRRVSDNIAIKNFHKYIYGWEFVLQTDHRPLLTIFGSKKEIPTHTTNRLQRWTTVLLIYSFKIECLSSKEIARAGWLIQINTKTREPLE